MATKDELGRALQAAHEAGDDESAAKLAAAYAAAPDEPAVGPIGAEIPAVLGIGDIAMQGLRGTAHQLAGTAFGVGSMIRGEPYMKGKKLYSDIASGDVVDPENPNPLPIKPVDKLTPEGQRIADAIGRVNLLGPWTRPGGKDLTVADVGQGIAGVGKWIDKAAGPAVGDVARSAATLATMRSGQVAETAGEAAKAVKAMRNAGFITTPTAPIGKGKFAGTWTERKLAGYAPADALISSKNADLIDRYAARAAKLDDGVTTPGNVAASKAEAGKAYSAIKGVEVPRGALRDPQFVQDVDSLGQRIAGSNEPVDDAILGLRQRTLASNMNMEGTVDRIAELRRDAFDHLKDASPPEAKRLGAAERAVADAYEESVDRFLRSKVRRQSVNTGGPSPIGVLYDNWVKARAQLSTLHIIEDAMNPTTGAIDASKIAKEAARRGLDKVDPHLRIIANAYNADSNAMRFIDKAARSAGAPAQSAVGMSVGAGVGGTLGLFAGMPAVGAIIGALAPSVSRSLAREFVARSKSARLTTRAMGDARRIMQRGAALGEQIDTDEQP